MNRGLQHLRAVCPCLCLVPCRGQTPATSPAAEKLRRIHRPVFHMEQGLRPMSGLGASDSTSAFWLLADTELADYGPVAVRIVQLQVIQQAAALADQHQQSTAGCMILLVRLEMLGQLSNPLTQNRNLDFRRTGVRIVGAEAFNQVCFLSGRQHGGCNSSSLSPLSSVCIELNMNARRRKTRQGREAAAKPAPSARSEPEQPVVES